MTHPDILLVGIDDVSQAEVTAEICPNLHAFRSQALELTHCYSHPVCSQSRTAILYGAWGKKLGTIKDLGAFDYLRVRPPASWPTLASALLGAGYQTALAGKWHCGAPQSGAHWALGPLERGYQVWLGGSPLNLESYFNWLRADINPDGTYTVVDEEHEYAPSVQLDLATGWWAAHAGSPRFLHASMNLPHGPLHTPPSEFLGDMSPPFLSGRARFLAMLRAADTAFGQLLAMVSSNTLVWVYSDNGTAPGSLAPGQPDDHAKGTTFSLGTRVLAMARWASVPVGPDSRLQHLVDFPAGILAAAGVTKPTEWDATTSSRSFILSEAHFENDLVDRAVRTPSMLLRQVGRAGDPPTEELYDTDADPAETTALNLLDPTYAGALAWLRGKLTAAALP